MNLKSIPLKERPRERALLVGFNNLSDAELIAIFLNTGLKDCSVVELANKLIVEFSGLYGLLNASVSNLCKIKGINKVKAIKIKAACELAIRFNKIENDNNYTVIKKAEDVYIKYHMLFNSFNQEKFMVLFLNTKNIILKEEMLFMGGINSSIVDVKVILKNALDINASKIICIHNHPSGKVEPSDEDIYMSLELKKALELCHIKLLDHVILGKKNFYSLSENNML